ncbi:MAG TPA: orotidine-5'-phosphate decarboxylase [Candidatus Competibacteraceae bacterium]|nr:MAG: orotidine-5'-phosphate decarboxylase [Candidatus Competibacteraceae bacterium]HOB63399.1 orotidine-5'-phosphate decarboxylase [Candidatus Competibacteraceae bacterium]HQA27508.1 orotidine-5'-phosphate decarboxylase [Candidatus Competibacteraceae bacterium]HQD57835.1 orotidine-5'-phosphate decarboxylase [Candidatus Competibacteraceae bacterium]
MSTRELLSNKPIAPADRLIFALDVPSPTKARELVETLGDAVGFYKIGLELFMAGGYFELIEWLRARDKKVFVDLKFFDVPETVRSAVRQLEPYGASFTTVHGNDAILRAAVEAAGEAGHGLGILAVTALTSLDQADLNDLGFACDPKTLVLSRARRALEIGCRGVISSGLEASTLRENLGDKLLIITPGIRPVLNRPTDDQKRTLDVEDAFLNGADHIVVGRPIRQAPDPQAAAATIQERIARLFAGG